MIKRLPWLRRLKKTDPEPPLRLPIACGAVSNGEGWWPDTARKRLIRKLVHEKAEEVSRREGIDRREFMASACGMATTLYMINLVNGCTRSRQPSVTGGPGLDPPAPNEGGAGMDGGARDAAVSAGRGGGGGGGGTGGYSVPEDAMVDPDLAECLTESRGELIIDMQTHIVDVSNLNPLSGPPLDPAGSVTLDRYPWLVRLPGCAGSDCYERAAYVDQILLGSDTTIGVVSGIPYVIGANGEGIGGISYLTNEQLRDGARAMHDMFPARVLNHCMVMPNDRLELQLAMMERNAATTHNWKTYTPWSPNAGGGYFLDSSEGIAMIQKGLDLGVPIFCVHKGLPLNSYNPTYTSPRDIGPVANLFPDAHFVVFHSAFEHGLQPGESSLPQLSDADADAGWGEGVGLWPEGPYNDGDPAVQALYPLDRGVNSLIKSLRDNNIGPNGTRLDGSSGPTTHVYAECGAVWANLMLRPEEAMHYFGKLLKHVGEERVLWGTDCLWFGSPQPLIEAFRVFEISQEFQDRYEYPALSPRIKAKILGQNAARLQNLRGGVNIPPTSCHDDFVGRTAMRLKRELDQEFGPRRDMIANVSGPRTRRAFLRLSAHEHREKLAWSARLRS